VTESRVTLPPDTRRSTMFPRSRPLCPKCATTTMLARITASPSGFDIRTFECPACANIHQLVVALVDPLTCKRMAFRTTPSAEINQCPATFSMLQTATGFLINRDLFATTIPTQSSGRRYPHFGIAPLSTRWLRADSITALGMKCSREGLHVLRTVRISRRSATRTPRRPLGPCPAG
jgi:hypothetical protein